MGLDQYAYTTSDQGDTIEIAYWRKHPNLHGWMEDKYKDQGGREEFNCINLYLDEEDIDELEASLKADLLPETTGFFFGTSGPHHEEMTRTFIKRARGCLKKGKQVFYTSWW